MEDQAGEKEWGRGEGGFREIEEKSLRLERKWRWAECMRERERERERKAEMERARQKRHEREMNSSTAEKGDNVVVNNHFPLTVYVCVYDCVCVCVFHSHKFISTPLILTPPPFISLDSPYVLQSRQGQHTLSLSISPSFSLTHTHTHTSLRFNCVS